MLQRQHRLPAQIKITHSLFYRTDLFVLKVAKNNLPESRYGFLVRKAVEKRATKRNRIRRRFRACVEESLEKITGGHDMLFMLEKGIIEKQKAELQEELMLFFEKKNLLK